MTEIPTVKLSIAIHTSKQRDEYYMFLADDISFQILSKLIPRLTLGSDSEICQMLGAEELNYLERTLSFTITDANILKLDSSKIRTSRKATSRTAELAHEVLDGFSGWIYNSITSNNLLVYVNSGLFNLEIVEFDYSNQYLVEAWIAVKDNMIGLFCPSLTMITDALSDKKWNELLSSLKIEMKPTKENTLRFTRLSDANTEAIQPLSYTIH